MKFLLIQFLWVEIPFRIPDSLIYRPPETLFTERGEIAQFQTPKTFGLFLSNIALGIKSPWLEIRRTRLPFHGLDGKPFKTEIGFNSEKNHLNLALGTRGLEFGKYINIEDSLEASFVLEYLFISYKAKNWIDYFPNLNKDKLRFYAVSYATLGLKIREVIVPYVIIERVERKHKVYYGISWLATSGYVGVQFKDNSISALYLNCVLKDALIKVEFDKNDHHYGLWSHSEYVPFDSSLLKRKLYRPSTIKTALTLQSFYFSYERRHFNSATVQNPSSLSPLEVRDFTENTYNFGIFSDNFKLNYTHFGSPYSVLKDTLTLALSFREKYYDLALYFNLRNHKEVFNMLNLEISFKTFKNLTPHLKVVNLFDVRGDYLPNIKAKRRYIEIGCQFEREI